MARHNHLTLDALHALEADDLDGRELTRALASRCPECLRVLAAFFEGAEHPRPSYRSMWHRLELRLSTATPTVEREIDQAHSAFAELARCSAADRTRLLTSDPRFTGRAFIDQLLDAARATKRSDPRLSLAWATDALIALERQANASPDQQILALALQSNAHRASGDFPAACAGFAQARALAEDLEDEIDLDTSAELDSLEGSLHSDLRNLEEAEILLTRALEIYQELGEVIRTCQILIQLGNLFYAAGEPATAIGPYEAALELLSPDDSPDDLPLYLAARLNVSFALVDLGKIVEARDLVTWDEVFYDEHTEEHLVIRWRWVCGRIAAATGQLRGAEAHFAHVRDRFVAQEHGFNAALVSLDLAHLYYASGRARELLSTVASAVRVFSTHALHREALAALIMLRDAIHQQSATAETIQRVATFLRDAARDPAARFQPPS
jgi:tetratricopeptide (TPR) repeat protein